MKVRVDSALDQGNRIDSNGTEIIDAFYYVEEIEKPSWISQDDWDQLFVWAGEIVTARLGRAAGKKAGILTDTSGTEERDYDAYGYNCNSVIGEIRQTVDDILEAMELLTRASFMCIDPGTGSGSSPPVCQMPVE